MIRLIEERCIGCGTCTTVCPTGAISVRHGKARVDEGLCTHCEACVAACPHQALAGRVSLAPVAADPGKLRPRNGAQDRVPSTVRTAETRPGQPGHRASPPPSPGGPRPATPRQQPGTPKLIPALGAALGFAVRELVPRLAPYLLDLLDPARAGPPGTGRQVPPTCSDRGAPGRCQARRGQQCRRWRARRS